MTITIIVSTTLVGTICTRIQDTKYLLTRPNTDDTTNQGKSPQFFEHLGGRVVQTDPAICIKLVQARSTDLYTFEDGGRSGCSVRGLPYFAIKAFVFLAWISAKEQGNAGAHTKLR